MKPICIIIPTLDAGRASSTGRLALATAGNVEARLEVVVDSEESGFTSTVNEGLERTLPTEDVLILNDDVLRFNYGWLATLQRALYIDERNAIAAPTGNCKSSTANAYMGATGIKRVKSVPFWCALIRRDVIDDLGHLDPDFIHYSSDTFYCYLAVSQGWRCLWVRPVYLWHEHEGSGFRRDWRLHDSQVMSRKLSRLASRSGVFG
jgi:hypothetical protein